MKIVFFLLLSIVLGCKLPEKFRCNFCFRKFRTYGECIQHHQVHELKGDAPARLFCIGMVDYDADEEEGCCEKDNNLTPNLEGDYFSWCSHRDQRTYNEDFFGGWIGELFDLFVVADGHSGDFAAKYAIKEFLRTTGWLKLYHPDIKDEGYAIAPESVLRSTMEDIQTFLSDEVSGASVTAVLIDKRLKILHVVNVGDVKASISWVTPASMDSVTSSEWHYEVLTKEHRASDPEEMLLIDSIPGCFVSNGRVNGELQLSRSVGDQYYRECQAGNSEPHYKMMVIPQGASNLVIATDGIHEAVTVEVSHLSFDATKLVNEARAREMNNDNKGVLIVNLFHYFD